MITSRYGNDAQAALGLPPLWPNVTIPGEHLNVEYPPCIDIV